MTGDLFDAYEDRIDALTLVPSSGGIFDVHVDEELLYSKSETGRFPEEGEMIDLFDKFMEE